MTEDDKLKFYSWLADCEGFRAMPYRCPAGYNTIGFGHVLTPNEKCYAITLPDAFALLKKDFEINLVQINLPNLTESQRYAFAELAFNIGFTKLKKKPIWNLLQTYSDSITKNNPTLTKTLHHRIGERFLLYCTYKTKEGQVKQSSGLLKRRQMDKKLWYNTDSKLW